MAMVEQMRPTKEELYLNIARECATCATCDRLHVGCVLVVNDAIAATGFNGSPRKLPHCDDVGHDLEDNHCVRTIHAEANAIAHAARHGISVLGATAYVTHMPCRACFYQLINSGIVRVVYRLAYTPHKPDLRVVKAAIDLGIQLIQVG